jgi:hypothetical protein
MRGSVGSPKGSVLRTVSAAKIAAVPAAAAAIWAIATSPEYRGGNTNPGLAFSAMPIAANGAVASGTEGGTRSILADALQEAKRSPLSSYPFAVAALAAERDGDDAAARRLMLRAMQMRPRSPAIRVWLAYSFAKTGQLNEAVQHAASLYELAPAMAPRISPLLAQLAAQPAGRQAVRHALEGTPHLVSIAQTAPIGSLGPSALEELLSGLDKAHFPAVQARVADEYLVAGDFRGARSAWGRFLPQDSGPVEPIYDGSFAGLPGSRPFNWELSSSGDLQAGPVASRLDAPRTALRVERVGSSRATAARQTLVVQPGRYRLSHLLRFEGGPTLTTPFAWQIKCEKPSTVQIGTLPLEGEEPESWSRKSWEIVFPRECGLGLIELTALPTDVSVQSTALITDVRLTPLEVSDAESNRQATHS